MAEICCGVVSDSEATVSYEPRSRAARRRRMEIRKFRLVPGEEEMAETEQSKRRRIADENTEPNCGSDTVMSEKDGVETSRVIENEVQEVEQSSTASQVPKFGFASVCGRRRDMEDAVDNKPSFSGDLHYFGVFDGHGCSHVAMKCRDRMHAVLKNELDNREDQSSPIDWPSLMKRSFARMDQEVIDWNKTVSRNDCRCELQTPECDAVGSTAVVAIVTKDQIIVANCGDSRAVLCRNGKAVALSSDHKPDRPDELKRIESAGGRVIYWEGPRVLGVLAMSRAIGDNYLKPYVICEPEITVTDRTAEDDCLILASDGLWDVVSNDTACGVAKMCLDKAAEGSNGGGGVVMNKGCVDTSTLLTKLALARRSTDNVSVVVVDLKKGKDQLR